MGEDTLEPEADRLVCPRCDAIGNPDYTMDTAERRDGDYICPIHERKLVPASRYIPPTKVDDIAERVNEIDEQIDNIIEKTTEKRPDLISEDSSEELDELEQAFTEKPEKPKTADLFSYDTQKEKEPEEKPKEKYTPPRKEHEDKDSFPRKL